MWTRKFTTGSLIEQADLDQQSIVRSMHLVKLSDGSSIKVFDEGQGDPIIFVPTVPELHFVYSPQLAEFCNSFRVILYDPQLSRKSFVHISDRAHELELLLEALNLQNAHIVAWSDAGSVAYYFAKTIPYKCKSLIFLGLADRYRYPEPLQFLSRVLLNLPIEDFMPHFILASILSRFLGGTKVRPEWIRQSALAIPQWTQYVKYSILPCMTEHQPHPGEVNTPSITACGDRDALVSIEQAGRMAKMLSNSRDLIIIPGGEHLLSFANDTPVNQVMHDFYARISAD